MSLDSYMKLIYKDRVWLKPYVNFKQMYVCIYSLKCITFMNEKVENKKLEVILLELISPPP